MGKWETPLADRADEHTMAGNRSGGNYLIGNYFFVLFIIHGSMVLWQKGRVDAY